MIINEFKLLIIRFFDKNSDYRIGLPEVKLKILSYGLNLRSGSNIVGSS